MPKHGRAGQAMCHAATAHTCCQDQGHWKPCVRPGFVCQSSDMASCLALAPEGLSDVQIAAIAGTCVAASCRAACRVSIAFVFLAVVSCGQSPIGLPACSAARLEDAIGKAPGRPSGQGSLHTASMGAPQPRRLILSRHVGEPDQVNKVEL